MCISSSLPSYVEKHLQWRWKRCQMTLLDSYGTFVYEEGGNETFFVLLIIKREVIYSDQINPLKQVWSVRFNLLCLD